MFVPMMAKNEEARHVQGEWEGPEGAFADDGESKRALAKRRKAKCGCIPNSYVTAKGVFACGHEWSRCDNGILTSTGIVERPEPSSKGMLYLIQLAGAPKN
jgi:hypothetical protein